MFKFQTHKDDKGN